jgi:hypothetical protein
LPPSGKYCGRYMKLISVTPFFCRFFSSLTCWKGGLDDIKAPNNDWSNWTLSEEG